MRIPAVTTCLALIIVLGLQPPTGSADQPKAKAAARSTPKRSSGKWQRIRQRGFFTVSVDPDNAPYSIRQEADPGIDVELARAVAKQLGLSARIHWINVRRETSLGKLLDGDCDVVMGLPVDPRLRNDDESTTGRILFTRPYYRTGYLVFVRKTGPKIAQIGKLTGEQTRRVGTQAGTLADFQLKQRGFRRKLFGTQQATLDGLAKRRIDFAYLWSNAAWFLRQPNNAGIEFIQPYRLEDWRNMAAAVERDDREFHDRLNRAFAELVRKGVVERLIKRYGLPYYPATMPAAKPPARPVGRRTGAVTGRGGLVLEDLLPLILFSTMLVEPQDPGNTASDKPEKPAVERRPPVPGKPINPFRSDKQAATEGGVLFRQYCVGCHGTTARGGKGPDLTDTRWLHGSSDANLFRVIRNGVRGTTMRGQTILVSDAKLWKIITFMRTLARSAQDPDWRPYIKGNPTKGEQLFYDPKGKSACAKCHSIRGRGGKAGPALSLISAQRSPRYLMESLVKPSADINPSYRTVVVVDDNGRTRTGLMVNEDNFSIQLRDPETSRLYSFSKQRLDSIRHQDTSLMPDKLVDELTVKQLHDLFAFLMTLDGQPRPATDGAPKKNTPGGGRDSE